MPATSSRGSLSIRKNGPQGNLTTCGPFFCLSFPLRRDVPVVMLGREFLFVYQALCRPKDATTFDYDQGMYLGRGTDSTRLTIGLPPIPSYSLRSPGAPEGKDHGRYRRRGHGGGPAGRD